MQELNNKLNQKICPLPTELLKCMRIDFSEDEEEDDDNNNINEEMLSSEDENQEVYYPESDEEEVEESRKSFKCASNKRGMMQQAMGRVAMKAQRFAIS